MTLVRHTRAVLAMSVVSPESVSLTMLGRADSRRADVTCRGLTVAGRPCRNRIRRENGEGYCHHHKGQQPAPKAKVTTRIHAAVDEVKIPAIRKGDGDKYPTPSPSPPPRVAAPHIALKQTLAVPQRKPVAFAATQHPLQFSTPPRIFPLSPPRSVLSTLSTTSPGLKPKINEKQLTKAFRKLLRASTPESRQIATLPTPQTPPPAKLVLPTTPVSPTLVRYPRPVARDPTSPFGGKASPTIASGVQRSWEKMWVPGIDRLGGYITCKRGSHPCLPNLRMAIPRIIHPRHAELVGMYALPIKCARRTRVHLRIQNQHTKCILQGWPHK
jgi:hypothetical protein